jgi:hypothetical protein
MHCGMWMDEPPWDSSNSVGGWRGSCCDFSTATARQSRPPRRPTDPPGPWWACAPSADAALLWTGQSTGMEAAGPIVEARTGHDRLPPGRPVQARGPDRPVAPLRGLRVARPAWTGARSVRKDEPCWPRACRWVDTGGAQAGPPDSIVAAEGSASESPPKPRPHRTRWQRGASVLPGAVPRLRRDRPRCGTAQENVA